MRCTCMAISSMSYNSLGCKVISTGSNYGRLINRNNSSIRMSYKVCVQIQRSTIASMSNCWDCSISMASTSMAISSMGHYSFSCKMISTGSDNSRFINRNNSSIWMSHQAIEWSGRRYSKTGSKNQELHDDACDAKVRMKLPM